jgi:hypothetical protein
MPGVTPTTTERNAAITAYGSGDTAGRAAALRKVADSDSVYRQQYNPAFVLMEYYGYMRRNPDDPPDNTFDGYDFWLGKMNQYSLPNEDVRNDSVALSRVRRAEMVKAFLVSFEYRERFFGSASGNQFAPASDERIGAGRFIDHLFKPRPRRTLWDFLGLNTSSG